MPGATARKRRRTPHQPTGTWIRPVKRLAIYLRDGFTCLRCWRDLHGAAPAEVTLDHFRPRSRGGGNDATNLYTCCRSCNSARGAGAENLPGVIARAVTRRVRTHLRRSLTRYLVAARGLLAEKRTGSWHIRQAVKLFSMATRTLPHPYPARALLGG